MERWLAITGFLGSFAVRSAMTSGIFYKSLKHLLGFAAEVESGLRLSIGQIVQVSEMYCDQGA